MKIRFEIRTRRITLTYRTPRKRSLSAHARYAQTARALSDAYGRGFQDAQDEAKRASFTPHGVNFAQAR